MSKTILAVLVLTVLASAAWGAETTHKFGNKPDEFDIKFYMQPRFWVDLSAEDGDVTSSFRVRRGRVYLTSKVAPNVKGRIQVEAKPETIEALDVYFAWSPPVQGKKPFTMTFGQFKKPFSYQELIMSSSNLNLVDRTATNSFLEKSLKASARDQGFMVTADLGEYDTPITLMAGLFNGTGKGEKEDSNSGKQFVGRADVTPVAGLSLGANVSLNRLGIEDAAESFLVWGADGVFTKSGFQLVSEVFGGDNYDGVSLPLGSGMSVPTFLAAYAEIIYRAESGWEPAARVESFDPDTDTDDDGFIMATGQIAKTFSKNYRWQINVVHTTYSNDAAESETELVSQWTVRL